MTEVQMPCFGSVLVHSQDDSYCQRCPMKEGCAIKVAENREAIQKSVGIESDDPDFWRRKKAKVKESPFAPATPVPAKIVSAPASASGAAADLYAVTQLPDLPVKVRAELTRWMTKAVDLTLLDKGDNPFAAVAGAATAAMIFASALRKGWPTNLQTRNEMAADIIEAQRLNGDKVWTEASVKSNVNIVATALAACGYKIIKEGK